MTTGEQEGMAWGMFVHAVYGLRIYDRHVHTLEKFLRG